MRLFTAIDVPDEVHTALSTLVKRLRPAARIAWSPPQNWHLTIKFIGEQENPAQVAAELAQVHVPAFRLAVRQIGWFPNPHHPRVLFAGITAAEAVQELHRQTDAACARVGVPPETRPFTPHLTLARIRTPEPLGELRRQIAELEIQEFGEFEATSFWLYSSTPQAGGSVYRKLKEFRLG